MGIISQLQEQVNTIASLSFNTFGTLQRDAPSVRLSPNYPEPTTNPTEEPPNVTEQAKLMSTALVQAAKKFDLLVAALPLSDGGEEAQLKRIAELEAENEAVGRDLLKQLEAAEEELKQVQDLFHQDADNCLNLKNTINSIGHCVSRSPTIDLRRLRDGRLLFNNEKDKLLLFTITI